MNKKFSLQLLLSVAVVTGTAIASEPKTQNQTTTATASDLTPESLSTTQITNTTTTTTTNTPLVDVSKVAPVAAAVAVNTTTETFAVPAQTVTIKEHVVPVVVPEQTVELRPAGTVNVTTDTVVMEAASTSTPTPTVVTPGLGDKAIDALEAVSKSVKDNLINPAKETLGSVADKVGSELNKVADLEASNTVVQTPVKTEVKDSEVSISKVVDSSTTDANLSSVVNDQAAVAAAELAKKQAAGAKNNEEAKTKTWAEYGAAIKDHVKDYKWYYGTVGVAVLGYAGYKAYEAYQAKKEADRERVLETLRSLSSN